MKKQFKYPLILVVLVLGVNLACGGSVPAEPTLIPTLESTSTPLPTNTAKPTNTPKPTATEVPPTFTAVPIKSPAINEQYEVKVLSSRLLDSATTGGLIYTANPGYKFLELGVLVKNLQVGEQQSFFWGDVYIIENIDVASYSFFSGSFIPKNNEQVNAATLNFEVTSPEQSITFDNIIYLRLIWIVADEKPITYLFGFDTSPLIEIPVK
ncbi:MAG: hypothetical protein JNM46_00640 [Anaerolineales bacterium]|nr:hypothetical protein [Anaerolineales bacterium]